MELLHIKTLSLDDGKGLSHRYDYSIIIDEMDVGGFSCESYGVRVAEQGGEASSVPHVTCSISRIDELMELLLRGKVTPVTLGDVVADWL